MFRIAGSSYTHNQNQTPRIMMLVCVATLPSIAVQFYFFSWGTLFQILLGCTSALASEALVLWLRKMVVIRTLFDNSALLTGLLLAISIPPLAPWWMVVLGTIFAVVIAKHLYGGLGHNVFNPAMIGYVVLLISFPVQMSSWSPPYGILENVPVFMDTLQTIFIDHAFSGNHLSTLTTHGVTQATPLNLFKTSLHTGHSMQKNMQHPIFYSSDLENIGWQCINLTWFLSGLFLLWKRAICWHIPVSFLLTLSICATLGWIFSPDLLASPRIHLLSGATMLGAFFILTDPVTAPTTNSGRLMFGALAGLLAWLIRSFGSYSDSVAFSALLSNITVPLIDYYTRPHPYGHH